MIKELKKFFLSFKSSREALLKGKTQYSWPPGTNYLRLAAFNIANNIFFYDKTNYIKEEVNCTGCVFTTLHFLLNL